MHGQIPVALREMDHGVLKISSDNLLRWTAAYDAMCNDAVRIGIPASALPLLPNNPSEVQLREARDLLNLIVMSFMSAEL